MTQADLKYQPVCERTEDQVKLVGVLINNKLSYNEYISGCLKQVGAKMNSIKRLGNFLSKNQKKILCYSYLLSYFKYCPIVWHFGYISNIIKIEKLHERVIRFIHSDYNTDYFTIGAIQKLCHRKNPYFWTPSPFVTVCHRLP